MRNIQYSNTHITIHIYGTFQSYRPIKIRFEKVEFIQQSSIQYQTITKQLILVKKKQYC